MKEEKSNKVRYFIIGINDCNAQMRMGGADGV